MSNCLIWLRWYWEQCLYVFQRMFCGKKPDNVLAGSLEIFIFVPVLLSWLAVAAVGVGVGFVLYWLLTFTDN